MDEAEASAESIFPDTLMMLWPIAEAKARRERSWQPSTSG
jgi:hypothetical protein